MERTVMCGSMFAVTVLATATAQLSTQQSTNGAVDSLEPIEESGGTPSKLSPADRREIAKMFASMEQDQLQDEAWLSSDSAKNSEDAFRKRWEKLARPRDVRGPTTIAEAQLGFSAAAFDVRRNRELTKKETVALFPNIAANRTDWLRELDLAERTRRSHETDTGCTVDRHSVTGMRLGAQRSPDGAVVHIYFRVNGSQSVCSGTMISSTHVLTAAHCLYNPHYMDGGPEWFTDVHVIPANFNLKEPMARDDMHWYWRMQFLDKPFGAYRANLMLVSNGWKEATDLDSGVNWDYGLIRLEAPIGDRTGTFGYRATHCNNNNCQVLGYPAGGALNDFPGLHLMHRQDPIMLNPNPQVMKLEANYWGGDSGGPTYTTIKRRNIIVGINSHTRESSPNCPAYAKRITDMTERTIAQWTSRNDPFEIRPQIVANYFSQSPVGTLSQNVATGSTFTASINLVNAGWGRARVYVSFYASRKVLGSADFSQDELIGVNVGLTLGGWRSREFAAVLTEPVGQQFWFEPHYYIIARWGAVEEYNYLYHVEHVGTMHNRLRRSATADEVRTATTDGSKPGMNSRATVFVIAAVGVVTLIALIASVASQNTRKFRDGFSETNDIVVHIEHSTPV